MPIQTVPLNFANLDQLDNGRIGQLLLLHLNRASQDCQNRPACTDKRTISIKFDLVPVSDPEGYCESIGLTIKAETKIPTYKSKVYEMKPTTNGLAFNSDFPDALDQNPLFPGKDEDEE